MFMNTNFQEKTHIACVHVSMLQCIACGHVVIKLDANVSKDHKLSQ